MNTDTKSEQRYDKSPDDDDEEGEEEDDDVDSVENATYSDLLKSSSSSVTHGRRRKRRGSRRVRKSSVGRHVVDKADDGHLQRTKYSKKTRSTADSPTASRVNVIRKTRRGKVNARSRPTSIEGSTTVEQKVEEGEPSDVGTVKPSVVCTLYNAVPRRTSPKYTRSRSPLLYQAKGVTRTAPSVGVDGNKSVRRLSTVNSDMVDISSTEREVLSYINARNRETIARLSHSRGYMEETFSRCMKLSCQPLDDRRVSSPSTATNIVDNQIQNGKRPVNLSTLSFDGCLQPTAGVRNTYSTQTFSLKYSRTTPLQKFPVYNADMFMRNGVFDPVEYLVHNRVACRMRSLDIEDPDNDDQNGRVASGLFRNRTRHPPKPILKACAEKRPELLEARNTSKCVRFACPDPESECC
ncbi:hypothetical protein LSH36_63g06044 [Paralvinella palmiformis]|uniref:Uncharacterized protein n=1 Tax=Paralvinella palmiformis TaxID=53620 RepID=A0AAD9K3W5_9ANNE|nr:hypothetical protein LSH36_63g06044 [Paralvinella palmiformis]